MVHQVNETNLHLLQPIIKALEASEVFDHEGQRHRLGDFLNLGPPLLVFVRQFGCIGCDVQMSQITKYFGEFSEFNIRSIVIGCGQPKYLQRFCAEYKLQDKPVTVFTDPTAQTHQNAKLIQSFMTSWGPRAGWDLIVGLMRGYWQSGIKGHSRQHGGALLVTGPDMSPRLRYYYRQTHLIDAPPSDEVFNACFQLRTELLTHTQQQSQDQDLEEY